MIFLGSGKSKKDAKLACSREAIHQLFGINNLKLGNPIYFKSLIFAPCILKSPSRRYTVKTMINYEQC